MVSEQLSPPNHWQHRPDIKRCRAGLLNSNEIQELKPKFCYTKLHHSLADNCDFCNKCTQGKNYAILATVAKAKLFCQKTFHPSYLGWGVHTGKFPSWVFTPVVETEILVTRLACLLMWSQHIQILTKGIGVRQDLMRLVNWANMKRP